MRSTTHHLAEFNVARLAAELDRPEMAEFVAGLDPINALADRSPGFVWRQKGEDGGPSTSIRPWGDEYIISFSVWESPDDFRKFVYQGGHFEYFSRRREWFRKTPGHTLVMWWVPKGHIPTTEEAVERLKRLRANGPSPDAFAFNKLYPPPDAVDGQADEQASGAVAK